MTASNRSTQSSRNHPVLRAVWPIRSQHDPEIAPQVAAQPLRMCPMATWCQRAHRFFLYRIKKIDSLSSLSWTDDALAQLPFLAFFNQPNLLEHGLQESGSTTSCHADRNLVAVPKESGGSNSRMQSPSRHPGASRQVKKKKLSSLSFPRSARNSP